MNAKLALFTLVVASAAGADPNFVFDYALQAARAASAQNIAQPHVDRLVANGQVLWSAGSLTPAALTAGQTVTVQGAGFGAGPDVDFSKILVGNVRVMERDLPMFQGAVDLLKQLFYETTTQVDSWPKEILSWSDTAIDFRIPLTAHDGPIVVQVQKRLGTVPALIDLTKSKVVQDPLLARVQGNITHPTDIISKLTSQLTSEPIPVTIQNPQYQSRLALGEAIFWSYDYNMGLVHQLKGMDWVSIFSGKALGIDGKPADPGQFGALPARAGEVPAVALAPYKFNPYPIPMPLKPLLGKPLLAGTTKPTGWIGFVSAEAKSPVTGATGSWIGMNCASCHAQRVVYEAAPGQMVAKVIPGIPNPNWTMRWNVMGKMSLIKGSEVGPDGKSATVDKSQIIWAVPPGTGEHTLVRPTNDGSEFANDNLFSPSAIPVITRHTPIRRALSHAEGIAGFEGSYIHAEEPDGAIGGMLAEPLRALTTYMASLDSNDELLTNLGIYRWLQRNGLGEMVYNDRESAFLQRQYFMYPDLQDHLQRGQQTFVRDCAACHRRNFGTFTDENMLSIKDVGTYFSPTEYQMKHDAIRTAMLRNLYWVEPRGLLHDGHVKSLEDLVSPDRCNPASALYQKYYTLNQNTFHIPKGTADQERALRRFPYFVDVSWDKSALYWDYQAMRQSFGPREVHTAQAIPLPAAPHPWCAQSAADVQDLVLFLLTL